MKEVPLDKIVMEDRFRTDLGAIGQLVESIREKGVIQSITVAPLPGGMYKLLAGGRRFEASKILQLKTIPAIIREVDGEIDEREIELIENVFRKDMTWPERSRLIERIDTLCREKNIEWSQRNTGEIMNMGAATVNRDIQLAKALRIIPELEKEAQTPDQAFKMLKQLEENAITEELRTRQAAAVANPTALNRGLTDMLKIADANYCIGDVFAGLSELRSNGVVHLIECDPPYGIDLTEQKRSREEPTSNVRSYNEIPAEAYPGFLRRICKELYRVANEHSWLIFWYGPTWHTDVKAAIMEAGWKVDDIPAIWNKGHGQTMQPAFNLARAYEPFFIARKGVPAVIKQGRANVFTFPPVAGQRKYHPTERPLPLMEAILETFVPTRANILVPFLGSGVTLRACYKLGCTGWGFDKSGEYKDKFMLAVESDTRALDNEDGEVVYTDEGTGEDDE
jgi:ParB/RepB/Spo0J family partition protein